MVECGPTASGFHLDPRHQRHLRELRPLNGDRAALHASLWRITNSRSDSWSITPCPSGHARAGNTRYSGCFRPFLYRVKSKGEAFERVAKEGSFRTTFRPTHRKPTEPMGAIIDVPYLR